MDETRMDGTAILIGLRLSVSSGTVSIRPPRPVTIWREIPSSLYIGTVVRPHVGRSPPGASAWQ